MKEEELEQWFRDMKDQLDIQEPLKGHESRFFEKLNQQPKVVAITKKRSMKYYWSIAASIVLLISIGFMSFPNKTMPSEDLASISPQMQETQSFFTLAIKDQLDEIDKKSSKETEKLIEATMKQMEKLETNYEQLKKDLVKSGNDKRVIHAMISNFQQRSELLKEVLLKIESINNLKTLENENFIL